MARYLFPLDPITIIVLTRIRCHNFFIIIIYELVGKITTFIMNTNDTPTLTRAQKSIPASLLKQLRATAALMCYDDLFGQPTMPMQELQRKIYNMYHGNEDLNMISQVDMMCDGKGSYSHMYSIVQTVVTNAEEDVNNDTASTSSSRSLVLHPSLLAYDTHIQYAFRVHYIPLMLKASTKSLNKDRCTGRFLMDLCKHTVANLKKASIIADEWMVNNDKPSGTNRDDLYAHLLDNYEKINPKEKVFTGFANFICHTKYNDRSENLLNILSKNDEDGVNDTDASRACSRKSTKTTKDKIRAIEAGDSSIFNSRGYTIDSRMQMVEIAQFQDAHKMEMIKNSLEHLTNRNKLLLDERLQQINLAKIICPLYDAQDEHWMRVTQLTKDIDNLKKEIAAEELKKWLNRC